MAQAVARMANALEPEGLAFALPAEAAPTPDQRAFMERRKWEIDDALAPATADSLLAELTAMFRVMAMRGGDEQELEAVIRVYLADVQDLPHFAVARACQAFRRGDVGGGKFAPTPGELRAQAKTYINPWTDERARLMRILGAKVLPPVAPESEERKQAALAHMRETAEMLKASTERQTPRRESYRPPTVREAQEWLDRYQEASAPLPKLSPAARKATGLPPEQSGEVA